jgi:hypothetical protein
VRLILVQILRLPTFQYPSPDPAILKSLVILIFVFCVPNQLGCNNTLSVLQRSDQLSLSRSLPSGLVVLKQLERRPLPSPERLMMFEACQLARAVQASSSEGEIYAGKKK